MTEKNVLLEVNRRARIRLSIVVYSALSLLVLSAALSNAGANQGAGQGQHVDLLGHNDLRGRESLQVTAKSNEANRDWVYVGHPDNTWDGTQRFNPITKQMERNGTTILKIFDPANSHRISSGRPTVIQINDVAVDHRGLVYASDRVSGGLFVLRYGE